ncbi:MAG: DUF3309 family protein [Chloroflexi bacterium]|nr:DUF3309 family protein [Chloroflexota bacterium]
MLITLLVVLLLLALLGGGYGHSRGWGYMGWSPHGNVDWSLSQEDEA